MNVKFQISEKLNRQIKVKVKGVTEEELENKLNSMSSSLSAEDVICTLCELYGFDNVITDINSNNIDIGEWDSDWDWINT